MSTFGQAIPVSLFGESHGTAIGLTIHQIPAGIKLDLDRINHALWKRRPKSKLSTPRQEQDAFEILSGVKDGITSGTPITIIIRNEDTRSKDYEPNVLRPSHADLTAEEKHFGYQDYRGSGHFSGRITAPIMILGAISEQLLASKGIEVVSHVQSVKNIYDVSVIDKPFSIDEIKTLNEMDVPVRDLEKKAQMEDVILKAKQQLDSVGGTIETVVLGMKAGYGEPFFDSVESVLSHLIYSVPAVKGVSFGSGFDITKSYGSEVNDAFIIKDGAVETKTNHSGGIQGGITNGMPIVMTTAIKPTASIGKEQDTVDIKLMKEVKHQTHGRHDPAIVHRAVHVVSAMTAYGLLELITRREGQVWMHLEK